MSAVQSIVAGLALNRWKPPIAASTGAGRTMARAYCSVLTVTGSQIGFYIQRRVIEYPNSTQTPDFGALELDDRGELVVRLAPGPAISDAITLPVLPAMAVVLPEPASLSSSTKPAVVRKSGSAWRSAAFVAVLAVGVSIGALAVSSNRDTASIVMEPTQPVSNSASVLANPTPSSASVPAGSPTNNTAAPSEPAVSVPWKPAHVRSPRKLDDLFDTRHNSPAPEGVVLVTLFAKNGVAFRVFENGVKLFDGPNNSLEVRKGETRTVVIKAKGFKDKTVVVTGAKQKMELSLERIPVNGGSGSGHITPRLRPGCDVFSIRHGHEDPCLDSSGPPNSR